MAPNRLDAAMLGLMTPARWSYQGSRLFVLVQPCFETNLSGKALFSPLSQANIFRKLKWVRWTRVSTTQDVCCSPYLTRRRPLW